MSSQPHDSGRSIDLVRLPHHYLVCVLTYLLYRKTCKHSYSASAIREYLGTNRNRTKSCPATGCRTEICLADLEDDKELAKRAKEAARRERARERDSDDDEVIE